LQQANLRTPLHEIHYAVSLKFSHDVAAVHFDGSSRAVKRAGNSSGGLALKNQAEHLPLCSCQCIFRR